MNDTPAHRDPATDGTPARDPVWARWAEIDPLLDRALDEDPDLREAWVRQACGEDIELRDTVLALLRAEAASGGTLALEPVLVRAALSDGEGLSTDEPERLIGTTMGAYRLTAVLGVGGMGAVYAAERTDGAFDRIVAVKVLKRSLNTANVAARFRIERQILASLEHPSIARLLDGGVAEDGRPFLVMEFVAGRRIDDWCRDKCVDVEGRIRLILALAQGVDYAHRHMVIHRDLKPGNVLVRDDGSVTLLDFGVAKLVDDDGDGPATRTRFMTPEYAAPEQLLGEPTSTLTDVFSLAALLYELLTGRRPYVRTGTGSMLEQVVAGGEPTAPSAVVGVVPVADAASREAQFPWVGAETEGWRRRLRGDIDAILTRALRARPTERYASVREFASDLERHLEGAAVAARSGARAYRIRKFVWRHRVAVAVLGGLFLLASGSAVGLSLQRSQLIEERNRATAAGDRAQREAETARQTVAFLTNLFEANHPDQRLGDTLTARALLERGVTRIDSDLATQPLQRAELLGVLGQVHMGIGLQLEGVALLERTLALHLDSIGEGARPAVAAHALANAQQLILDLDGSRENYLRAIDLAVSGGDTTTLANARLGLGRTLSWLDEPDSAEAQLRAGLALLDEAERSDESVWSAQQILAGIVRRQGNLEAADSLYSDIINERRAATRSDPVAYGGALNDLAVVRRLRGQPNDAVELYNEALDTVIAIYGPAHPTTLLVRGNLGTSLEAAGRWEEAVATRSASLAATREEWPDGHWQTARALAQLGATQIRAGRAEDALWTLIEAVDLAIEQLGASHTWAYVYRGWLGVAGALTGRAEGAERVFGDTYAGLSTYEGLRDDSTVSGMLRDLVDAMRENGLHEQADRFAALIETAPSS